MKKCFRIKYFPISFFAPILGLAGFSLATLKIENLLGVSNWFSNVFILITGLLFLGILIAYLLKILFFWNEVAKEYHHPIKINFFPLVAKILLVMSVFFLESQFEVSKWFWIIGVILTSIFSFNILGEWISKAHFKIEHLSPAWFIPVVGNLIIPIAGVNFFSAEISWFFFSVGVIWMFLLTTIVMYRLIFHPPMPNKLAPTLFILFAAPAIAFIAYYKLTGEFDAFAHLLYYFSLFLFGLIMTQWRLFTKSQFFLSWWAYTFPLAAFILATVLMYSITKWIGFEYLSIALWVGLWFVVIILSILTFKGISKKQICVEEE